MSTSPASWERRPLIEKESNRRGAEWGGLTAGINWSEKNLLPILQRHSELEPLLPDLFTADLRREMHSGIADLLAGQTAVKSSVDALIARGTLVDAAEAKLAGRIKAEYEKRFQSAKQRFDAGMVLQARDAFVEILRDLKLDAEIKDPVLLGRAYTNLGTCEWHAGNTDAAAQYFEEAYSYNRDDVRCIANLASAQMLRGEPFAALETVERALALEPENEVAVATKGNILLSAGRYDEAIVFAKEKTKDSLSKYFKRSNLCPKVIAKVLLRSFVNSWLLSPTIRNTCRRLRSCFCSLSPSRAITITRPSGRPLDRAQHQVWRYETRNWLVSSPFGKAD